MKQVSVVSGTYNRLPYAKAFVESVRTSTRGLSYEIILVDGGSTDGTIEWARKQSDVVLIERGLLDGAVNAFNVGFAAARGRYVAIGNDDVEYVGSTLKTAYDYLESHPDVGQVAFENIMPDNTPKHLRFKFDHAFGYLYGQCCLTRRWLGDVAGWWGNEGYYSYGGDTHLGMRIWELGWKVVPLKGCAIRDRLVQDDLRVRVHDAVGTHDGRNKDTQLFRSVWRNRLPSPDRWIPCSTHSVVSKAARGALRTLRFKIVPEGFKPRTGMIDAFRRYGPSKQVGRPVTTSGMFQRTVMDAVVDFRPDVVLFQSHVGQGVRPGTIDKIRHSFPGVLTANFIGDWRPKLPPAAFDVARAVNLQFVVSPDVFQMYADNGVQHIAWWLNTYEPGTDLARPDVLGGTDVVFLASVYQNHGFPEAETRPRAVAALTRAGLSVKVQGRGWGHYGIEATYTEGRLLDNARMYANAKMALSISATRDVFGYTSDRLFFICATGCPALVQRFVGMEALGFVDGETCIAWGTMGELIGKARYYANHDDEREEIGRRGKLMVTSRHSYTERVKSALVMLEGIEFQ